MGELHSDGKTAEDIRGSLRTAPLSPHVAAAIKAAYALGCELRVLSDANAFFIDTILAHHGLAAYFSGTDTNPAHVDAAGRLRIRPYHDFGAHGHGCTLPTCPPNMCKVGHATCISDQLPDLAWQGSLLTPPIDFVSLN